MAYEDFSLPVAADGPAPAIGKGSTEGFDVWEGGVHDDAVKAVLDAIAAKDFATEDTLDTLFQMLSSVLQGWALASQMDALMGMVPTSGQSDGIASQIGDVCVLLNKLMKGASTYATGALEVGMTQVELKAGATALEERVRLRVFCEGDAPIYIIEDGGSVLTGYPIMPGTDRVFNEDPSTYTAKYAIAGSTQTVLILEEGQ